jgi:copper chaperone CopZ
MTLAGAASVPAMRAATKNSQLIVTYKISGFTCVTCAVGLDVMLQRQKGISWSKSDYQAAKTSVCYQPDLVSDEAIRTAIADMGFIAEKQR